MTENRLSAELAIFTIGHSNHELEKLIHLFKPNEIDVLVDIRSNPFSRFAPHFNKDELKKTVQANGMKYLFLGQELGGQPEGSKFYNADGFVLCKNRGRC